MRVFNTLFTAIQIGRLDLVMRIYKSLKEDNK